MWITCNKEIKNLKKKINNLLKLIAIADTEEERVELRKELAIAEIQLCRLIMKDN